MPRHAAAFPCEIPSSWKCTSRSCHPPPARHSRRFVRSRRRPRIRDAAAGPSQPTYLGDLSEWGRTEVDSLYDAEGTGAATSDVARVTLCMHVLRQCMHALPGNIPRSKPRGGSSVFGNYLQPPSMTPKHALLDASVILPVVFASPRTLLQAATIRAPSPAPCRRA